MYVPDVYSVSHRIDIKSGVHQWYVTFGHQCSISVVKPFFSINFKINDRIPRLKFGGSAIVPLFEGTRCIHCKCCGPIYNQKYMYFKIQAASSKPKS